MSAAERIGRLARGATRAGASSPFQACVVSLTTSSVCVGFFAHHGLRIAVLAHAQIARLAQDAAMVQSWNATWITSFGFHPVPDFTGALFGMTAERAVLLRELLRALVPFVAFLRVETAAHPAGVLQALARFHADQQRGKCARASPGKKAAPPTTNSCSRWHFILSQSSSGRRCNGNRFLGDQPLEVLVADPRHQCRAVAVDLVGQPQRASRVVWRRPRRAWPYAGPAAGRAGPRPSTAGRRCRTGVPRTVPVRGVLEQREIRTAVGIHDDQLAVHPGAIEFEFASASTTGPIL